MSHERVIAFKIMPKYYSFDLLSLFFDISNFKIRVEKNVCIFLKIYCKTMNNDRNDLLTSGKS